MKDRERLFKGGKYEWIPKERKYVEEKEIDDKKVGKFLEVTNEKHPLIEKKEDNNNISSPLDEAKELTTATAKPSILIDPLSSSSSISTTDPLSLSLSSTKTKPTKPIDPLSAALFNDEEKQNIKRFDQKEKVEKDAFDSSGGGGSGQGGGVSFIPWSSMKPNILRQYTTDEHITVSFLSTPLTGKISTTTSRLEQLDEGEEGSIKETLKLTQKEYIEHIENLREELVEAWDNEERVRALKIAIRCSKVLNEIDVLKFFPSKFVLATEILDTFGDLVYERIRIRGETQEESSKEHLIELARETCRNWFFKIYSIRELLPRLYVEMSLMKCYTLLSDEKEHLVNIISRISLQGRGVYNPLLQIYLQTYLYRKAIECIPDQSAVMLRGFKDLLRILESDEIKENYLPKVLENERISKCDYFALFSPAFEWLFQCLSYVSNEKLLEEIVHIYSESSKNLLILNHIIGSFLPSFIAKNAVQFTTLIREGDADTFPQYQLYRSLGVNLCLSDFPKGQGLRVLNEVWKVVTKFEDPHQYLTVAEVFIEFPLKNLSEREVSIMLRDIWKHVTPNKVYEQFQTLLQSIVQKIQMHYKDFGTLFGMESFLKLLDLLQGSKQVELGKGLLVAFEHSAPSTDPVVINTMFTVASAVHDSINSLSFQDDVRQISRSILKFIDKVDYGRDVEKQLNFYVDCRKAFSNLDVVKEKLIMCVSSLAMKTFAIVKGKHNKKTGAFARACLAFSFITIPSMDDVFSRLHLYLHTASIALINQSLTQADSFLKAAVTLLQEVQNVSGLSSQGQAQSSLSSSEDILVEYVAGFLSFLVVLPGHPDHGPFYIVNGLLKVVREFPWKEGGTGKARVYLLLLQLCSTFSQKELPYHIPHIESNDVLYDGDFTYVEELDGTISLLVDEILAELTKLKENSDEISLRLQSRLALDLFNITLAFAEVNTKSATLCANLYFLIRKNIGNDYFLKSYCQNSLEYLKLKATKNRIMSELYKKLVES